jgi:anti-sigma factor RsiW
MTCEHYRDALADLVDGALDPAEQQEIESHLEKCAACQALVADLRSIRAAAFTLERLTPPPHLLPELRARVAALSPPEHRRASWFAPRLATAWMAAAAALVLVTSLGLWSVLQAPPPAHVDPATAAAGDPVASVQAELHAATEHYERAIAQLEQIARNGGGVLDPQVAAVLQKNLEVIDQAIDENRQALEAQPASPEVQEGLFEAMRSKVALLQQTVELINEMRKGNQAEAGRLIQGLNQ